NFKFARINISQGVHTLRNQDGFAAYSYGFVELESYGYSAGATLDNLNFEPEVEYAFDLEGEKVACLDQEGRWRLNSSNPDFTYFVWVFGDGLPPVTGQEVSHTFAKPGVYEDNVLMALSPNFFEQQEELTFELEVVEAKAALEGEVSVCPEVEQVMYRAKDLVSASRVSFAVEGGVILEDYGDSVLVNWGPANPNARVKLTPYSANGCPGAFVELAVV